MTEMNNLEQMFANPHDPWLRDAMTTIRASLIILAVTSIPATIALWILVFK